MKPHNFHRHVRSVLLPRNIVIVAGPGVKPKLPQRFAGLNAKLEETFKKHDDAATETSARYRSAVWMIYGLTALATASALLNVVYPHGEVPLWSMLEVAMIAAIFLLYSTARRRDWLEHWLEDRRHAELLRYLPLAESLPEDPETRTSLPEFGELRSEARASLAGAWQDDAFVAEAVPWLAHLLADQQAYHHKRYHEEEAIQHRVHKISSWLFVITGAAAVTHLWIHTEWLTLVTATLPAIGAALNGALAQLESQRLARMSSGLEQQLQTLGDRLQAASQAGDRLAIQTIARDSLRLVMREHEEWRQTVEKREVPLA